MTAWRARLYSSVRRPIISFAFLLAASIAMRRAAKQYDLQGGEFKWHGGALREDGAAAGQISQRPIRQGTLFKDDLTLRGDKIAAKHLEQG